MRLTRLGQVTLYVVGTLSVSYMYWHFCTPGTKVQPVQGCKGDLDRIDLERPLRVGVATSPDYAAGIAANNGLKPNKNGIYRKQYGLCVDFLLKDDIDARVKELTQGGENGVDVLWSTVDFWANELPALQRDHVKAQVLMQVDWSLEGVAIVADNSINQIEDLKGVKISLPLRTQADLFLERTLQNSHLNQTERSQILGSLVDRNTAEGALSDFVNMNVGAAVVWEPYVTAALTERPDSHVLSAASGEKDHIASVMVAREDFVIAYPKAIQAFVKGWVVNGTERACQERGNVAELFMENEPIYKKLGRDQTLRILARAKWARLEDNVKMFNLAGQDVMPLFDTFFIQATQDWVDRGYITGHISPALAKNDHFIRTIYNESHDMPMPVETLASAYFEVGRADLSEKSKKDIKDAISLRPRIFTEAKVIVEGYTDNAGEGKINQALSQVRAQVVADYLVSNYHIPRSQITPFGKGDSNPVALNDTTEGKRLNRRTEIKIVRGKN